MDVVQRDDNNSKVTLLTFFGRAIQPSTRNRMDIDVTCNFLFHSNCLFKKYGRGRIVTDFIIPDSLITLLR